MKRTVSCIQSVIGLPGIFHSLLVIFLLASFSTGVLAQSADFNNTYIIINDGTPDKYFKLKNNPSDGVNPFFDGASLGSFSTVGSTLLLQGAEHNVYKCGGCDLTSTRINYRIYPTGSPSGSFSAINIGYFSGFANGCGGEDQQWKNTSVNQNLLTGLGAGNYTIEVYSDASITCGSGTAYASNGGANFKATFSVTCPSISLGLTYMDPTCAGGANNGSIDITPSGGTAPYGVLWSNGSSSEDLSGLEEGVYTVLVTDALGCSSLAGLGAELILSGESTFYADADGDGYGDAGSTTIACSAPVGYVADNTDCDDGNSNKNPGETEICDGIDNNCDGNIDEGLTFTTYYADADGDTYGDAAVTTTACDGAPAGYVSNDTDCNDGDAAINPAATEICDGIDNNCDGNVDEGLTFITYYADADGDTYGDASVTTSTCDGAPSGYVADNTDCDDSNAAINPATDPLCAQGNDDCDGAVEITVGTTCSFTTYTSVGATATAGVPAPGCGFYAGGDVWFKAVVPASGNIRFELQNVSGINAQWALYTGTCGSLSLYACNQLDLVETYSNAALAGDTIWVRVYNYNSASGGTFNICAIEPEMAPNNFCADAIPVTVGESCVLTNYTAQYATGEPTSVAPNPTCGFYAGGDVWFTFVWPASGALQYETTNGTGMNAQSAIYSGTCGAFTQEYCVQLDNENTYSNLALAGQTVYLRVYDYNSEEGGEFSLCLYEVELAANDNCADAIDLPVGLSCSPDSYDASFVTAEATSVSPNPTCGFYAGGDVWFTMTVPASGEFRIETTGSVTMNPQTAIYTGVCGAMTQISCNQLDGGNTYNRPDLAGQTLYIRVYGYNSEEGGEFTICAYEVDVPTNDNCSNATELAVGYECNYATYTNVYSTAESTSIAGSPTCGFYNGGDVWFSAIVPPSGLLSFNVIDGGLDQIMTLYSGSCGAFTQINCTTSDALLLDDVSLIGQTVYLRMFKYNNEEGSTFDLCVYDPSCAVVIDSVVITNTTCIDEEDGVANIYATGHNLTGSLEYSIDNGGSWFSTGTFSGLAFGDNLNIIVRDDADDVCSAIWTENPEVIGTADPGTLYYADTDGDGFGDASISSLACDAPMGYVTDNSDCNDANNTIYPGAIEVADDGIDQDCNGFDAVTCYVDLDGDSYGNPATPVIAADGSCDLAENESVFASDCNDGDAAINPAATEICDGIDNNCDGNIDEGIIYVTYYADADGDTYGDASVTTSTCDGAPAGFVTNDTDCNDGDAAINPGATEICDGIDNNCDGNIDEGLTFITYYADADSDGYGDASMTTTSCDGAPAGYVSNDTDCNDGDATINPGATEICDGIDNNCDGNIDEGTGLDLSETHVDATCETGGSIDLSVSGGTPFAGPNQNYSQDFNTLATTGTSVTWTNDITIADWYANKTTYNTGTGSSSTGAIYSFGASGSSERAIGSVASGGSGTLIYGVAITNTTGGVINSVEVDYTGEQWRNGGNTSAHKLDFAYQKGASSITSGSWTDVNALDFTGPVALATSATLDGNLSANQVDINSTISITLNPGETIWLRWSDIDDTGNDHGLGIDNLSVTLSGEGTYTYTWSNGETTEDVSGLTEDTYTITVTDAVGCSDEISVDISLTGEDTFYADADGDGYGDAGSTTLACTAPSGYVANNTDCNDGDGSINPGATEICDGIDNNCDGNIDEGLTFITYYADVDGDGYGDASMSTTTCDGAPVGYVADNTDCDDNNNTVYPGAVEIPADGIDQNCDGIDADIFYADTDGDGFGDIADFIYDITAPSGYVGNSDDCDDSNATIYPGATEICDGLDNNCDGNIDEGLTFITYYADADGDTYGDASVTTSTCDGAPVGYVSNDTDCNDGDAAINPGATEICDGIDNNCDGNTDESGAVGELTFFADTDGDGFGDAAVSLLACSAPVGYVSNDTDCNDGDAAIYPGATEICDGIDNNCDGNINEGTGLDISETHIDATCETGGSIDLSVSGGTPFAGPTQSYSENFNTLLSTGTSNTWTDNTTLAQWYSNRSLYIASTGTSTSGGLYSFGTVAGDRGLGSLGSSSANPVLYAVAITNTTGTPVNQVELSYTGEQWRVGGSGSVVNTLDFAYQIEAADIASGTWTDVNELDFVNPVTSAASGAALDGNLPANSEALNHTFAVSLLPGETIWLRWNDMDNTSSDNGLAIDDVSVVLYGEVSPYNYLWSNGDTTEDISGLEEGTYTVTITDAIGCSDETVVEIVLTGEYSWYADADGDGFGDPTISTIACLAPVGYVADNTDCNDNDNTIYPGASEIALDGIDQDCDGIDASIFYADSDGDTYGDNTVTIVASFAPVGFVADNTDCNDLDGSINPGATEICDGIDNNCDGNIDEGLTFITYYADADGDTYGDASVTTTTCDGAPAGYVSNDTDCNDSDAAINPGATEICDGIDNNCDGNIDEGLTFITYYADADGDTYGDASMTTTTCDGAPAGYVSNDTDCNDSDAAINPGATEICDGIDNNCDGNIDEGLTFITYYADADGDTYGDASVTTTSCDGAPAGYVSNDTDCNDSDAAINPGATEICDGIDNNCDGNIDEGLTFITYYADADGDTYGDASVTTTTCDGAPAGYVSNDTDCNDSDAAINPGATEICDGIDNNCDGNIDEGLTFITYYADADGDGYGDASVTTTTCDGAPAGYVSNDTDCNDGDAAINPFATEICDGIDNNCDGNIDEGLTFITYYADADGDGYGDASVTTTTCDGAPVGYVSNDTDCNDGDAAINPGATEICDGIDNNCDGNIDDLGLVAELTATGSTTVCKPESVELTATVGVGYTYSWYRNGLPIPGAPSGSTFNASKTGSFTVIITSSEGCIDTSNAILVTVNPRPDAEITFMDDLNLCLGSLVGTERLAANGGVGNTYQWLKNSVAIPGATNRIYFATETGNYRCVVTNAEGCSKVSNMLTVINVCREAAVSAIETGMKLYPNPADASFTVEASFVSQLDHEASIEIYDLVGNKVYQVAGQVSNGVLQQHIIPDMYLEAGLYHVYVRTELEFHKQHIVIVH